MSETPGDRLRKARIAAGYAEAVDAARAFGWNEHTYKSHENGARGIKLHVARKYAQRLKTSAAHILTGMEPASTDGEPRLINVPVVGVAAAGLFRDIDWRPDDGVSVPALANSGAAPEAQYALLVEGPSVNKRIEPGMYAICARLEGYKGGARHGSLVHCERHRAGLVENTIKELRYGPGGAALWPVSDHPDHQSPIQLDSGEADLKVEIRGVVIGKFGAV